MRWLSELIVNFGSRIANYLTSMYQLKAFNPGCRKFAIRNPQSEIAEL